MDKKIKEIVEAAGQKTMQDIEIIFMDGDWDNDHQYLNKRLAYKNIIGHQIGQHWVAILVNENVTKLFKTEDIQEITVTAYKE